MKITLRFKIDSMEMVIEENRDNQPCEVVVRNSKGAASKPVRLQLEGDVLAVSSDVPQVVCKELCGKILSSPQNEFRRRCFRFKGHRGKCSTVISVKNQARE